MKRFVPPKGERGAALLTVLLLVAVMGALAAVALERMRLATSIAVNTAALDQARAYAFGVERLMLLAMNDLLAAESERTSLQSGWQDQQRQIPLPGGGIALARATDGGNCFNLNSLATAPEGAPGTVSNPTAIVQFAGLMQVLEVPQGQAVRIAESAADWVDGDGAANPQGGEDSAYRGGGTPYLPANAPFADASEIRAVQGMTTDIYARVRPYLCALPDHELSPINVNTLTPEQAPLISMLEPRMIPLDVARRVIAERPAGGWSNLADFWTGGALAGITLPMDVQSQPQLKTGWFKLSLDVTLAGAELAGTALVDAREAPARVIARQWGTDE
ncbi:type II secretion system minor pseudopilin GspK [Allosphingosinicella vermicomposti]|uniref:type II secretion system minor pseudopilin GspK n=1 Tax=Allosphingosinicella vermicomposti TaxID=614671 RepID=UPI000D10DEAA|nr:type II secretion system minor pseudopilin GspK [Allosphingosinicella vermicomposti]